MIPSGVVTVYAKWHEQIKNIQVTLHVNYGDMNSTVTVTANEGEVLTASEAIDGFTASINTALKDSYLGAEADLAAKPVFLFSEWAYDEEGSNRFEGKMPHVDSLDLYAVWTRSAAYCQIRFTIFARMHKVRLAKQAPAVRRGSLFLLKRFGIELLASQIHPMELDVKKL